jgi:hypothetical protein
MRVEVIQIWILEVGGRPVTIAASWWPATGEETRAQFHASEPPNSTVRSSERALTGPSGRRTLTGLDVKSSMPPHPWSSP